MTTAAFVVNRVMLTHTSPKFPIRLRGYGILAAVAYDGQNGIEGVKATEPMPFSRPPRKDHEFDLWGDGLLVRSFKEIPKDLGWVVTLTLTDTQGQAQELLGNLFKAGAEVAKAFPGAGSIVSSVLGAGSILASALKGVTSARTVATWIGSEVDDGDLQSSFSAEYQGRKSWMQVEWRVDR